MNNLSMKITVGIHNYGVIKFKKEWYGGQVFFMSPHWMPLSDSAGKFCKTRSAAQAEVLRRVNEDVLLMANLAAHYIPDTPEMKSVSKWLFGVEPIGGENYFG